MKPTQEQIIAAIQAVDGARKQVENIRRARSTYLFGHSGAHISGCQLSLEEEIKIALNAALARI